MPKTEKLDMCKANKADYAANKKAPQLVKVSPAKYLTISGEGAPGGDVFNAQMAGLYGAAFTIKMTRKFAGKGDYKVSMLEGLWWGHGDDFFNEPRDTWCWKLLIRTPEFITAADLKQAKAALAAKGKPPEFKLVKLETIREGECVQMLHVGPYRDEPRTVEAMRTFAAGEGLAFAGTHHEIYLSDPRRVAPERLRTILRYPVRN